MSERWIVITTVNPPGRTIELVSRLCLEQGWSSVVVGDTTTPAGWAYAGVTFLSVQDQRHHFGRFADLIPYRHYCRKNLGYLYAIENGARLILETDDDNHPYDTFGHNVQPVVKARLLSGPGWVNVYPHFLNGEGSRPIWPRGLPLDAIDVTGTVHPLPTTSRAPIQQFLADNDPDVDAVYRLTTKTPVFFDRSAESIVLDRDAWAPFNSQNTLFFSDAFPLLYLPCYVSFRMTDIWRSFVAQAALSGHGLSLAFHGSTVEQVRNEHDLMRDFADEVVGYLSNRKIAELLTRALDDVSASENLAATSARLWQVLMDAGIVPPEEKPLIDGWFERIRVLG